MGYFWNLYWLRLKAAFRSPARLACVAVFLILVVSFGCLLPQKGPSGLTVGIFPEEETGEAALTILEGNGDYQIAVYQDLETMEKDILTGKLHCGYRIGKAEEPQPVTVYNTEASYLRPLLDQLVLSAYFEAMTPHIAQDYLEQRNLKGDITALLEKQRQEAKPLEADIRSVQGFAVPPDTTSQSVQPLLYAVLASLFLAAAILEALLPGEDCRQRLRLTAHPFANAVSPAMATATVHLMALLVAEGVLSVILPDPYYPLTARLTMLILLAFVSAVPAAVAGSLRGRTAIATLLPPWVLIGVFCSGALIDTAHLPAGIGLLRFLSPGWYVLGWMRFF